MREIKFRAWDTTNKKWLHDICIEVSTGFPVLNEAQYDDRKMVLQQFTGLCDTNGIKIFEGDLIKEIDQFGRIYEVKWFDNGWSLAIEPYHNRHFKDAFQMEVIGNIYENKE